MFSSSIIIHNKQTNGSFNELGTLSNFIQLLHFVPKSIMFELTGKIHRTHIKSTDAAAQRTFLRYAGFKWILLNKAPGSIQLILLRLFFSKRRTVALLFTGTQYKGFV